MQGNHRPAVVLAYLFLIVPLACVLAPAALGAGFIVKDGEPKAEIVIAENPPRTARLAAWELQTYIEKISGAKLPIVAEPTEAAPVTVYVGESPWTQRLGVTAEGLKQGAYRMVAGDDWLALIGDDTDFIPIEPYARFRSERGSEPIISAWDEISGARWGHPAGNAFKMRFRNLGRYLGRETSDEPFNLWAYDERGSFNAVCGFLRQLGVRWYMPGELGEVVPEQSSIALPEVDRTVRPDFPIRDCNIRIGIHDPRLAIWGMRLGMRQPHGVGWAHGLNGVTPREEMKREHPEHYALYAGKRETGYRSGGKQCLSSPGLFNETVRYARTLFDHYDAQGVSVMPADGYTALCQCHLCEGKDTPDRGYRGRLSDYVWDFVERVAEEVRKTHPDRKIGNMAYGAYKLPPLKIDKLPDNVLVGIVGARRPTANLPEEREEIRELRRAWMQKTDNKLLNFENYPLTARGFYLPAFVPHVNAASINAIKGTFLGENIQPSSHRFMEAAAFNSFKFYFTFRMYWGGKGQDIDPMLNEYYRLFYGPAEKEMKAFFEYCEANWREMEKDREKVDRTLELFAAAEDKVAPDSVYAKRIALMADYLQGLKDRSVQLEKETTREDVPEVRMWRGAHDVEIDGKLDDEFWKTCPGWAGGHLRELQTGREPFYPTRFKVAWGANGIYFAIRCQDTVENTVNIGTTRNEDPAIWYGDVVEILLETQKHSYYQIAVNPAGALCDLDRAGRKQTFRWDSQADVATHVGEDYWTVEIRIPVVEDTDDPLHQVVGRKQPRKALPWYFNVCRQRVRDEGRQFSAFSPTGRTSFHVVEKFAKLYYK